MKWDQNRDDLSHLVAGIDEAGRGPLAGPVVAAAVILHPKVGIEGLADSKKLSEKERERLFREIRQHALHYAAGIATVEEIDRVNILKATFLAMQRAVGKLKIMPNEALVDGNLCPLLPCAAKAIIGGDDLLPAISAASIVAKVLRDRLMKLLDRRYPQYGFARHKGYATHAHFEALKLHGPCQIHRRSFSPVAEWFYHPQLEFL